MKKTLKTLALAFAIAGLSSAPTFAATISNTGPGSDNTVTDTSECTSTTNNNNNVDVTNNNPQTGTTGSGSTNGNTTGGNTGSGNADNQSNTNVDGSITNGDNNACAVATATPVVPGRGGDAEVLAANTATPAVTAAVLPDTAGQAAPFMAISVAISLIGAGVIALSRRSLKASK